MEFRVVGIGIRIWKLELAETRPRLGRDHGRDIAMCEPRHQIKHKKRHFDTKKKTFWIRDPLGLLRWLRWASGLGFMIQFWGIGLSKYHLLQRRALDRTLD